MRNVVIAVIAAIVVLSVAWWFLFFSPAGEQLTALRDETSQLESQAQMLRNQITQLEDIREREVEIQADLARLEEFIPVDPSQASLVRQIQLAADAANVVIDSLNYQDPSVVQGAPPASDPNRVLGEIVSTVNVVGGYFQIADFLRRLEVDVPRALLVTGVELTESGEGFPLLTASIESSLYALITPPPQPGVAAPADTATEGEGAADGAEGAADGATEATEGAGEAAGEDGVETGMLEARA